MSACGVIEAATGVNLQNKLFLKTRKIHRKTPVSRPKPATLSKKRLWHRSFPLNLAKVFKALFDGTPLGDYRKVFRTLANIYDAALSQKCLMTFSS